MYQVEVTREGRWWMVSIPEIGGLTQARRLGEVELMAREYVSAARGVALDDVEVHVRVVAVGDVVAIDERLAKIRAERDEAARLEREASQAAQSLARELVDQEVPLRDIGTILGVSHQRAHQLAAH